ncbi:MAG: gephyrin-like molybdotransferase Glp [Actinomycetota bacterium]|nr:molybdopterin molybdenumtransferase MoeA [Actinomycetota bacterium]
MGLKAGFGRLATLGEVFDILYSHLPSLGVEEVELSEALHRVNALDVICEIDVPHFRKSGMDGFAVRAEDTFPATDAVPVSCRVTEAVWPGMLAKTKVEQGTCIEIGTGAPLPEGADAVVMVEYTEAAAADEVLIRKPVAPRENIIEIGSDLASGAIALSARTLLEPRHLGVLAACGHSGVSVVVKPKIALFSTGPELVEAGGAIAAGRIFDINTHTLKGALQMDGAHVLDLGIVADDWAALADALEKGLAEADLVMLSGGSSLGGGDLVTEVFEKVGTMLVHGAAVKPGKPVVLGVAGEKLMIGLPGYPMSALSDYYIFVQPFLRRAMGLGSVPLRTSAILSRKHPSTVGRYEFLPVRLEEGQAIPINKGSSSISAMAEADGFVEIDENTEVVEKGQSVEVRLF